MSAANDPRFGAVERDYNALKTQLNGGQLTREQFEAALQKLMVQDEQGRYWMMGAESGAWYVYDGQQWIQDVPPSGGAAPIAPAPVAAEPLTPAAVTPASITEPSTPAAVTPVDDLSASGPATPATTTEASTSSPLEAMTMAAVTPAATSTEPAKTEDVPPTPTPAAKADTPATPAASTTDPITSTFSTKTPAETEDVPPAPTPTAKADTPVTPVASTTDPITSTFNTKTPAKPETAPTPSAAVPATPPPADPITSTFKTPTPAASDPRDSAMTMPSFVPPKTTPPAEPVNAGMTMASFTPPPPPIDRAVTMPSFVPPKATVPPPAAIAAAAPAAAAPLRPRPRAVAAASHPFGGWLSAGGSLYRWSRGARPGGFGALRGQSDAGPAECDKRSDNTRDPGTGHGDQRADCRAPHQRADRRADHSAHGCAVCYPRADDCAARHHPGNQHSHPDANQHAGTAIRNARAAHTHQHLAAAAATATRTPVVEFQVTFGYQGYENWGNPSEDCASFNDKSLKRQLKWDVTVTNRSATTISTSEWAVPTAISSDGSQAKVCPYPPPNVPSNLTAKATFRAYVQPGQFVVRIAQQIRNTIYTRCLDAALREVSC